MLMLIDKYFTKCNAVLKKKEKTKKKKVNLIHGYLNYHPV